MTEKPQRNSCYNTLSGNSNDHISNQEKNKQTKKNNTKKHELIPVYPDIDQSIANKKNDNNNNNNPQ